MRKILIRWLFHNFFNIFHNVNTYYNYVKLKTKITKLFIYIITIIKMTEKIKTGLDTPPTGPSTWVDTEHYKEELK